MVLARKKQFAVAAVCAVVLILGLVFYAQKQMGTPGFDALNEYTSLGIFMVSFLFFEAVSAGCLLFVAIEKDGAVRLPLAIIALVAVVCSGISVIADVGNPAGLWQLWLSPVVKSPIFLDIVFMSLSVVASVLVIVGLKKNMAALVKVGRFACGILSIVMPLGTSLIFTGMSAAIGFESLLELGYFLLHSVLAGVATLLLLRAALGRDVSSALELVTGLLVASTALSLAEAILCLYRTDTAMESAKGMIMGDYAPIFWIVLLVGMVAPLALAFAGKAKVAAALSLVGVFGSKVVYIFKGNMFPYIDFGEGVNLPMLQAPVDGIQMIPAYVPTMGEWMIVAAVFAIAVATLAFALPASFAASSVSDSE